MSDSPKPPSAKPLPAPKEARVPRKLAKKRVQSLEPHVWEDEVKRRGSQPSWLNDNVGTRRTCVKCGVTVHFDVDNINFKGFSKFVYRDALNNELITDREIGCPTFLGQHKGTTVSNKERIRELDDRVDDTEDRVDTNTEVIEDHDSRLITLEQENRELRARIESAEADVGAVVNWLKQMVAIHNSAGLPSTEVEVEGKRVALPGPVAELIIDLGQVGENEYAPIPVSETDSDA